MSGVGGKTIDKAKRSMSYAEFLTWSAYRNKRGSLNTGVRVEQAAAMLAALYASGKTKKPLNIYDFMPHFEEPPMTLEQMMREIK
jgi:hypothetical protein